MKITTVKISGEGYLVNGTMSVPKAEGNRHYQSVQEWIAGGGTPDPEFNQSELDVQASSTSNAGALAYLVSTDWYVTRFVETGEAVPGDVTAQRAASRLAIV